MHMDILYVYIRDYPGLYETKYFRRFEKRISFMRSYSIQEVKRLNLANPYLLYARPKNVIFRMKNDLICGTSYEPVFGQDSTLVKRWNNHHGWKCMKCKPGFVKNSVDKGNCYRCVEDNIANHNETMCIHEVIDLSVEIEKKYQQKETKMDGEETQELTIIL